LVINRGLMPEAFVGAPRTRSSSVVTFAMLGYRQRPPVRLAVQM